MTPLDGTRVFLPRGRVAHILDPLKSPNDCSEAECGLSSSWASPWHGTGTQDETDRALDLPTCKGCLR
jgi:hypothetical protein